MPDIIYSHFSNEDYNKDFIVMNFLEGENAGNIYYLLANKRKSPGVNLLGFLVGAEGVEPPTLCL